MNDSEHLRHKRICYERGCLCIEDGRVQKLARAVPDGHAVCYYESADG